VSDIWVPMERQKVALSCPAQEPFFGGARGGGKTDWLLGDALSQMEIASSLGVKSRSVLFRRTYKELEEVIERSYDIYQPLGAKFGVAKATWEFPGAGALKLRYLEKDADYGRYHGHSYDWIGFDELGNYGSPYLYNQMSSCNRHAGGMRLRMPATGNPGGPGQAWIKKRWISGKKEDHIYTFPRVIRINGEVIESEITRCFIPSKVTDNEYWMKNNPLYIAKLDALPEHLRRAYLDGDWDVNIGQAFGDFTDEHIIEPFQIPYDWYRFATLDWGYVKPYSLGVWVIQPNGRLLRVAEKYGCVPGMEDEGVKVDAKTAGKQFVQIVNSMGIEKTYIDPACYQRHGHGRTIAELLSEAGLNVLPADRDRKAAIDTFHTLLQDRLDDGMPAFQVFSTCKDWLRTVPNLVSDKHDVEDVDTDAEDHTYDDTRFAIMAPETTRRVVRASFKQYSGRNYLRGDIDYAAG
jgi:hypothetical protein